MLFRSKELPIENLIELNKHSERLLAGMYEISKLVKSQELQVLQSSDTQKKFKSSKKVVPLPKNINADEMGNLLKGPINVLLHMQQFQATAIKIFGLCADKSHRVSLTETYPYTINLITLYTNCVKLGIYLSQISELSTLVNIYRSCIEAKTKKDDQELVALYEFVRERESVKALESELQCMNEQLLVFSKSIVSSLALALGSGASFPWKMFSLSDNPTTMLESDSFILPQYLVMFHLNDICEMLLCFFSVSSQVLANEPKLNEIFATISQYCLTLQIYGDSYIDVKTLFNLFKKVKDKKADFDVSFFEAIDSNYQKIRLVQEYKRRRLGFYINNFLSAVSIDASLLCTKFAIGFALIGFSSFEIKTAFRIKSAKPSIQQFNNEISELLYYFTKLTTFYLNSIPDIQRYFVYNIHEFDAPFLDTLTHSFTLSQSVYDSLSMLIEALRIVDISEFDNQVAYDLTQCLALIYSIFQAFSGFSISHGTAHLVPLFQLLSGVYFRTNLYQNTFSTILQISKINTFWCHLDSLQTLAMDSQSITSKYNAVVLQLCHYHEMDVAAVNEISSLQGTIEEHYKTMSKLIIDYIKTWTKSLQETCYVNLRNQTSSNNALSEKPDIAGEESKINNRKNLKTTENNLQKISSTLLILHEIGVIKIGEEEHDVPKEICTEVSMIFKHLFNIKGKPPAPTDFIKELRTAKTILQLICSCSSLGYLNTYGKNLQMITFTDGDDDKIGPVAASFCDGYKGIIQEVVPVSYYSNTHETLILVQGKQLGYQPSQYFSNPAFSALKEIVGLHGCERILKNITKMVNPFLKVILSHLAKAAKSNGESYYCSYSEAETLLHNISNLGLILQIRRFLNRFTDSPVLPPHLDKDLMEEINELLSSHDIYGNAENAHYRFLQIIGTLFSLSYWESVEYDPYNDSFKDNSHLIANVIDLLIGYALYTNKITDAYECYSYFFSCVLNSITIGKTKFKSNKKNSKFPVHLLIILADQVVKVSAYADYSTIEQAFSYRLIRQYYSKVFNQLKNENQKGSK